LLAAKFGVIQKNEKESLSKLIFNITLPMLIILKTGNIHLNAEIARGFLFMFIASVVYINLFLLGGKLSAKLFNLGKYSTVHSLHTAFGNTVLLGFPILDAVFPNSNAILYATIVVLVSNSMVWTVGVYQMSKTDATRPAQIFKFLLNPNTIAFAIGLSIMFLPVEIPDVINTAFYKAANATFPLSMFYIGSVLAEVKIKKVIKHWHVLLASFNKLLLFPFLLILALTAFLKITGCQIDYLPRMVLVLEAAMPCQVVVVILAGKYNKSPEIASEQFTAATLFSILTIPVMYWAGMYFMQNI